MERYWKLLDIENGEYSIHETEEEVNHIIEYKTRNFSDDKVTKRINIETPFSNYDFQFVCVFDEHHIHQFLYFYDTIEEEHDDFEERIMILQTQRDNAINLLNKKTTDLFNANRTIDFLRKRISESDDSERSEIEYLKEAIKSKESRIDVLEAGVKESERNEEFWKSQYNKYKKFVESMHKQSADFMYGNDDDFPF